IFFFAAPQLRYDHRDVAQQKRLLAKAFAGQGWEVPRLLEAMWHAPDFYFDSVSQVQMDGWSRGRVALVGDAGYCVSPLAGLGTGLALVGGYVLAGELAAAGGEYGTAFARYEQELRGYVREGQKLAKFNATGLIPRSRAQIWMRNLAMQLMAHLPRKA